MKPKVSIIVPCLNERNTIVSLLQAICEQTYPVTDIEVIIADGMSTDGTRDAIRAFSSNHPELAVQVVDNPDRIIPAALNRAIEAAKGEVIVRLDAHSIPHSSYVERCLSVLEDTGAANVGGVWEIRPSSKGWMGRSIAAAASHWLGAGDARYRTGGEAGKVDTVPFGAFKREWVERIGYFDQDLLTNEDYEFNVRLRKAGGVVWFDPTIRSAYFARRDLTSLVKQYARYGYWKARMLSRHPGSLRWRQAIPPLFVLVMILMGIAVPFCRYARLLLGIQLALYGSIIFVSALGQAIKERDVGLLIGFPLAIWTIHFAWGGAFLWSILSAVVERRSKLTS